MGRFTDSISRISSKTGKKEAKQGRPDFQDEHERRTVTVSAEASLGRLSLARPQIRSCRRRLNYPHQQLCFPRQKPLQEQKRAAGMGNKAS